jgi:hypothetical protein
VQIVTPFLRHMADSSRTSASVVKSLTVGIVSGRGSGRDQFWRGNAKTPIESGGEPACTDLALQGRCVMTLPVATPEGYMRRSAVKASVAASR